MTEINVVMVEDSLEFASNVINLIKYKSNKINDLGYNINFIDVFEDGSNYLNWLKEGGKANIVILDLKMTKIGGLETLQLLKERNEIQNVIIYSNFSHLDKVIMSFDLGAKGYVNKLEMKDQLIYGIIEVYNGRQYVSHQLKQKLHLSLNLNLDNYIQLDLKEINLIQLIYDKLSIPEIAKILAIPIEFAEKDCKNLYTKLSVEKDMEFYQKMRELKWFL